MPKPNFSVLSLQRNQIVGGAHEPTDEESQWAEDEGAEDKGESSSRERVKTRLRDSSGVVHSLLRVVSLVSRVLIILFLEKKAEEGSAPVTGIPDFWLTAIKNTDIFADWVKVENVLHVMCA